MKKRLEKVFKKVETMESTDEKNRTARYVANELEIHECSSVWVKMQVYSEIR